MWKLHAAVNLCVIYEPTRLCHITASTPYTHLAIAMSTNTRTTDLYRRIGCYTTVVILATTTEWGIFPKPGDTQLFLWADSVGGCQLANCYG